MSKFPLFWITFLPLTADAVLCQDVRYNFDNTANFSKFKTYKWITLKSEAPIDKLTDEEIKAALISSSVSLSIGASLLSVIHL